MAELTKNFWKNQKILVTGGNGFLGSHVVNLLKKEALVSEDQIFIPSHKDFDLREKKSCEEVVKNKTIVIHLAANVGGIGYINSHPAEVYFDNLIMGTLLMDESMKAKVSKFVAIGTTCSYPAGIALPCKEDDLWKGFPDRETAPYGIAKRMLSIQGEAYRKQYSFNSIFLLPSNLYGPNDNFDPKSSHVIAALINKFYLAKKNNDSSVSIWGKGKATREFLYVEDAARGILLATEHYNDSAPVNLGSGKETSIKELAEILKSIFDYKGEIVWEKDKPEGKPRLCLDTSKAKKEFGFEAKISLKEGLIQAIKSFESFIL